MLELKNMVMGFLKTDGRRMYFSFLALVMAVCFMFFPGLKDIEELKSTGVAILIGLAMHFYNKVRSSTEKKEITTTTTTAGDLSESVVVQKPLQ